MNTRVQLYGDPRLDCTRLNSMSLLERYRWFILHVKPPRAPSQEREMWSYKPYFAWTSSNLHFQS